SEHKSVKDSEDVETVFIQDNATRWIKRLIRQAHYEQAIELAQEILAFESAESYSSITRPSAINISEGSRSKLKSRIIPAHPVFWASLHTYYGESLIYSATEPEHQVEGVFQYALSKLEKSPIEQDQP